jgi:hypothetical protein
METIHIGCTTYTQAQAIAIMRHHDSRDKTYDLASELIAAKLNIACKHSNSSCVASAIAAADAWLCQHPVGSGVRENSSAWHQIEATFETLERYNEGALCAPRCHEDDDER